jgi:hypothetical protein
MTISGVSSCSSYDPAMQQMSSRFAQARQAFDDLGNALQSGDLSDAQSAFAALTQIGADGSQGANASRPADPNNPIANDLSAVGQALQSGDLKAAQSAFQKVQRDLQVSHRGRHHHHRREEVAQNTPAPQPSGTRGPNVDQLA